MKRYFMMLNGSKVGVVRVQVLDTGVHNHYVLLRHVGGLFWSIPPVYQHIVEWLVPPTCPKVMHTFPNEFLIVQRAQQTSTPLKVPRDRGGGSALRITPLE